MSAYVKPTAEQEAGWKKWVAERSEKVRLVAEKFEPWSLYRLKSTGHRVTIVSFSETDPVTLTVAVTGEFNAVAFDRQVFGISPDDLEPCELPDADEPLGTAMSATEVGENIDAMRVMVRPDLWEMGPDGKARRKDN